MIYLLAGNPNVGKSTLFNLLTQSNVSVGNYSGVTVEKRVRPIKGLDGYKIVDLPGTYNVAPSSEDEGVVTNTLINEHYNGIINIVDSTHIKRNLHLTIQLLELGLPTLVVCNLEDALKENGYKVDVKKMSTILNSKTISISARKNSKVDKDKVIDDISSLDVSKALHIDYGEVLESAIKKIHDLLRFDTLHVKKRWLAVQLLEGNEGVLKYVKLTKEKEILEIVQKTEKEVIEKEIAFSLKGNIFNARRKFINDLVDECLIKESNKEHTKYFNYKIDTVLTHPIFGIPIFLFIMFLIYHLSFGTGFLGVGAYLTTKFDVLYSEHFIEMMGLGLNKIGISGFIYNLLIDGVLAGVGGVLVFLPQIIILFYLLAILEGTGYMARVSIVMDRVLSKYGFNGKSVVPLITGLGCTVPAIMATRTIIDKKERLLTIITLPFISCSARLPIYGIFVSIFFDRYQALVIMFIYLLGVIVTLFSAKILSRTYFKSTSSKFVLEVPPYRLPQFRTVSYQALEKAKRFVKKAGTFILIGSIILWLLSNNGPSGINVNQDESFLAYIAGGIKFIFVPLGFGTWEATSSLISGFLAKEVVASSLEIIYSGNIGLYFTTASALTFVVFSSLYIPCISTVATIKSETNSKKWTFVAVVFPLIIAYFISLIVRLISLLIF